GLAAEPNLKVLTKTEQIPKSSQMRSTTEGLIQAPTEKIWDTLIDFDHYKDFMPRFTQSKILEKEKSRIRYHAELNMPWPIADVVYNCDVTLSPDHRSFEFNMVPGTGKGMK